MFWHETRSTKRFAEVPGYSLIHHTITQRKTLFTICFPVRSAYVGKEVETITTNFEFTTGFLSLLFRTSHKKGNK